jgi:hypothetical protein
MMTKIQLIVFLIVLGFLVLSLIVIMFIKGYYHFRYLKITYPKLLEKYKDYSDIFLGTDFFNIYRFSLIFPCFSRKRNNEVSSSDVENIVRKVIIFSRLIYLILSLLILLLTSVIIIYGDAT